VREEFAARRLARPAVIVLPGFDEHDGQGLVMATLASLAREPTDDAARLLKLATEVGDTTLDRSRRSKLWQLLFEAIMRRWLHGEIQLDTVESFTVFEGRVREAFTQLRDKGRGEVAVFTSVGPIAVVLAQVLGLPAERAFEQAWRLYNTSITRVVYSGERLTLDGFNEVAHLSRADWTHR
jgi:broad specificity phosphatase PhoE